MRAYGKELQPWRKLFLVLESAYFELLARSDRPGRGKRGPASGFSVGVAARGFAQVTAQRRDAYFGSSHILPQPADVLDALHPQ